LLFLKKKYNKNILLLIILDMETINIYKKYIKKHKKDIRELEREIRVYLKKIDELLNKEELPK